MRKLPFILLLISTFALAQGERRYPSTGTGAAVTTATLETTAALNLFVDTTGLDTNACTSAGAGACLTIQGAVDKVPKRLKHLVTITVGAGSFSTGAMLSGFVWDPASVAAESGLRIVGTMATATAATGTASGAATAVTAGSGLTHGTLTDGAATWTVNDFRGKLLSITSGTGAGNYCIVTDNTATVATCAGSWSTSPIAAPVATSGYVFQNWATDITGQTTLNGMTIITANTAAFWVGDSQNLTRLDVSLDIQQINFTAAVSGRGIWALSSSNSLFRKNRYLGNSSYVAVGGLGTISITHNYIAPGASGSGISTNFTGAYPRVAMARNYQQAGVRFYLGVQNGVNFTGDVIRATTSHAIGMDNSGAIAMNGDKIDGATGFCINIFPNITGTFQLGTMGNFTNVDFSNCTSGAINAVGNSYYEFSGTVSGTGNTGYGITLRNGAKVKISSATTVTGSTNDIDLDTVAYTYVALRALAGPPAKSITDLGTLSRIWEP